MREGPAAFRRLAAIGLLAACSGGEPERTGGTLTVEWVGGDTGKLVAPAAAEWCDSLRMLELRAVHGDTGIALVVYFPDSAVPGEYTVVVPEKGDSARPAAAIAMRWFAETSIRGFSSDSGAVTLASIGPGGASGTFAGGLRSATEGTRLTVTGSFRNLAVGPAPTECAGAGPDPDDTDPDTAEEFRETAD